MRQRRKPRPFTAAQSAALWDRWRRVKVSSRSAGCSTRPPPRSSRTSARLAAFDRRRGDARAGANAGRTRGDLPRSGERAFVARFACCLGRAPSTVSRELARNGGRCAYRAAASDQQAWHRALRPKACRLATHPLFGESCTDCSSATGRRSRLPGWLRLNHPEDEAFWVSHETIYRSLFVQARGVLKKALIEHLRTHRAIRRSRHATAKDDDTRGDPRHGIDPRSSGQCEDRAVPGHWEGDLLSGSANSYIVTLVERQTRYAMLAKIAARDTRSVINALIKQSRHLPEATLQVADLGPRQGTH